MLLMKFMREKVVFLPVEEGQVKKHGIKNGDLSPFSQMQAIEEGSTFQFLLYREEEED